MRDYPIYKNISAKREQMSKSQHKIADYILENPHTIPFITVAKLASLAEVSEATVVRFASFLGYKGYNDLQQNLANRFEKQLNTVERLNNINTEYNNVEQTAYMHFNDDISNIKTTIAQLDIQKIEQAAEYIRKAKRVYIIANRSAVSLGTFLHYYLNIILGNSELVTTTEASFDQIYDINDKDIVIGVSYARYTKSTLHAVSYAAEKNATIIALTDHLHSPITSYSDISLFASSRTQSFLDSFVAPLSVLNTLITFIGKEDNINTKNRLDEFEKLWDRFDVFYDK